jgi:hypothetical protein
VNAKKREPVRAIGEPTSYNIDRIRAARCAKWILG